MKNKPLPFGTILGYAPGNVPVFSSDYKTADATLLPDRHAYRHYVDGVYTGYKWQCVEFARRWLLQNKGYVFDDIAMAYDIFRLQFVKQLANGKRLPLHSFENGSLRKPEPGCMLIWNEGGEFDVTGHVAIVTEVLENSIRIAEQNLDHQYWADGCSHSRELPATLGEDGSFWIQCSFHDASILGWVIQTDDATHAVPIVDPDSRLMNPLLCELESPASPAKQSWLNLANPDEAAYVALNGNRLCSRPEYEHHYVVISETAEMELKRATNELHALFMHATDYVLQNEHLLARFNLPREIWPRLHQSWNNRRNQMITGRFDFCMTEKGLKVFEYNADSASCHMECGKVQGLWAQHYGCDEGEDAGEQLFDKLEQAWRASEVDAPVHILLDDDKEEMYHARFMQAAMEKAGVEVRLVMGLDDLHWGPDNSVLDRDGEPIRWIWKTWAWETALDQLRLELAEDSSARVLQHPPVHNKPRLMDVLFRPETMVFEPIWTLVPSNKAILPILWEMFPDHPYLLESSYQLNEKMQQGGYVVKPIAGRCGFNISIIDEHNRVARETDGHFDQQDLIYQQLFPLPRLGDYRIQLSSFSVAGSYAGSCIRADQSMIITTHSDLLPLRVIPDRLLLSMQSR